MAKRNEEFRRLQAYHENTRIAIRYLDTPMAHLAKEIKVAFKKMPGQKDILQLGLDELDERRRRVRIRRVELAPLPEEVVPTPGEEPASSPAARRVQGEYGIEIITPTAGAAQTGIPQGDLRRWHARIKPADGCLVPKERVRWSSDKEGVLKGIEETRLDEGRATHAFIQFKFRIPGKQVVTVEAVDNRGNRYEARLPVKVIPVLPETTRLTGEVPEEEVLFRAKDFPTVEFIQPSEIGWTKGLPMHRNITFVARLQSSDGKPFKARNVRFMSDKDGNLGVPLVEFKDKATYAHVMFLFPTQGERTITITAIDEAGKKATTSSVLNILPRALAQAPEGLAGEVAGGEAPFTVGKLIAQRLRPAADNLHGLYANALKHANRDMQFLVKWRRRVEKDFADVRAVGADVQKDARDGRIDKLKKHINRLTRDLRAFESRITLFNRAMREQRMLTHFLAQTRDGIITVRNLARQITAAPEDRAASVLTGRRAYPIYDQFETASEGLAERYAAIRSRIQEMGRRVQRIDGGIKHYKEDLNGMIDVLQDAGPHEKMAAELASRLSDLEGTVQKELLEDINGMIELLRGIIGDVTASQRQLDRLEKLSKESKA